MKHLKSLFSRRSCFKSPPHLPQNRQQQKTQPTMENARAKTGPSTVTTIMGAHQSQNCKQELFGMTNNIHSTQNVLSKKLTSRFSAKAKSNQP